MNRRQIRERVKVILAIPEAGDGVLTDGRINDFIADGLARLSTDRDWPWLLTSSALTFTSGVAALPTGFMKARVLLIASPTTEVPARYVPLPEALDSTGRDYTYVWSIVGASVVLYPTPDTDPASATLYYYRAEPALADDDDEPLMPAHNHHSVVAYTAHLCYAARQDTNRAQTWYAEYEQWARSMRDDLRQSVAPRRVRERESRHTTFATWS